MGGYRHVMQLEASLTVFDVIEGSLSLDDTRLPYMQATATVAADAATLDASALSPAVGLNNGIFKLRRFPAESTVADQDVTFTLHSRRARLALDRTIEADFHSVESLLGDLRNPYLDLSLAVPGDIASLHVGPALTWLFTDYLENDLKATYPFALSGAVPSMPITLADGESNLKLLEGANLLTWMEPHLARYNKVLRSNEASQLIIADRENVTAGNVVADAGVNMVDYREEIDRDGDLYADQVSVHFQPVGVTWVSNYPQPNALGVLVSKVAYIDRSSEKSPVNQFTTNPEAIAQGMHQRFQRRYKTMTVRLKSDYSWRPGMAATIVNPLGQQYTARVQSVRWDFPDAEMEVGFRDVQEVP